MSIYINYNTKLTAINRNIVIFVSSLSQLKNIDFFPNHSFYLNDKEFINQINNKQFILIKNIETNDGLLSNIMVCLVKNLSVDNLYFGSQIYNIFSFLHENKESNITFYFTKYILKNLKNAASNLIFGFCLRSYKFNKYKISSQDKIILNLYKLREFKELRYNLNLLQGINFSKDLVSEPANILNPISYSKRCLQLKEFGLKVEILDKNKLKKIGMRSLLSVSEGSNNEPRVVILRWNIKKNVKPTILVGKGVTFDSGGISLKPASGMEEMITDMGGSAVVVGSMINAALNKSAKSLVGIIGLVENMPGGKAQRPGDIITSMSGQTIEVLNTDAEGRLVLADIITYVQKQFNPAQIIDFATLTGAIMIALGTHKAGLFSNNDKLSKKLEIAGTISHEKIWRFPLSKEYDDEINSKRADMKNIGSSRFGGSIHAAQFIQRFIENKIPWAHLDIAGVSWTMKSGQNALTKLHAPGSTVFGIRLIDQFLKGK